MENTSLTANRIRAATGAWLTSYGTMLQSAGPIVRCLLLPQLAAGLSRRSALAFTTSFGRFPAAGVTFRVGAGVARYQTIGKPIALTALALLAEETRDKELPV